MRWGGSQSKHRERERERDWAKAKAKDNDEENIGCCVDREQGRFSFWERSVWCFWLRWRMYNRLRSIKHKTFAPLWSQMWDKMRSRFWSRRSHRLKNLGVSKMNATWNLFMEYFAATLLTVFIFRQILSVDSLCIRNKKGSAGGD